MAGVVFVVHLVQDPNYVIVDGLSGVAAENEVYVVEVLEIDLVDAVAVVLRDFVVQVPSVLQRFCCNKLN